MSGTETVGEMLARYLASVSGLREAVCLGIGVEAALSAHAVVRAGMEAALKAASQTDDAGGRRERLREAVAAYEDSQAKLYRALDAYSREQAALRALLAASPGTLALRGAAALSDGLADMGRADRR